MTAASKARHQGIALILVLWVLVLLTIIAGSFAYSVHGSTQMAANSVDIAKAQSLADGGVFRGVFEMLSASNTSTAWKANGKTHPMQLAGQTVAVTLTDEAGKIDINGAPPALLVGLMQSVGLGADQASELAQEIAVWRSPPPTGAGLQPPIGALVPHGPFTNVEELQQIPGLSPRLFRLIAPLLTVYTGLPGVNTLIAPVAVLRAIPGVSPQVAQAYAQQRMVLLQSNQAVPPLVQAGTYNIASLSGVVGVQATVQLPSGVVFSREAVVRVTNQPGHPYQILSWREGSLPPAAPMPQSGS